MAKKYSLEDLESLAKRMIGSDDVNVIDLCDNLGQLYDNVKHTEWFKIRVMGEIVREHVRYPEYTHLKNELYIWMTV